MMDKYIEVADKAYDLADFTVKDAKKQDDDSYVVTVSDQAIRCIQ